MDIEGRTIKLQIAGLGIVFYSPASAAHITEGENYFAAHYKTDEQVQPHIQEGSLVGFATGSPGDYELRFHEGYPTEKFVRESTFKLRLGLRCSDGVVCFRDLYDLFEWSAECPPAQMLTLPDGIYHVTLCSNVPRSGIIGDNQEIHVYLQLLDRFPALAREGVPTLCY